MSTQASQSEIAYVLDQMSRAKIQLLEFEPYYYYLVSKIKEVVDNKNCKTAQIQFDRVNSSFTLLYNTDFFKEKLSRYPTAQENQNKRIGVVKHELLHMAFGHHQIYDNFENKNLMNVCMDLVVNECIEWKYQLEEYITLKDFAQYSLPQNSSTKDLYNTLMSIYLNTIKGVAVDQLSETDILLKSIIEGVQDSEGYSEHSWQQYTTEEIADIEYTVENMLLSAEVERKLYQAGNTPSELKGILDQIIEKRKPVVDWKKALRNFMQSIRTTKVKYTKRKFSKRYDVPPGIKRKRGCEMLVVVDTSGSIDMTLIRRFFAEIDNINNHAAKITVCECDCRIGNIYPYKGVIPEKISGGGGTDFNEPILYANKNKFSGIVYLTDGYGSVSEMPNMKMLWLITKNGQDLENLNDFPGQKIKFND